MKRYKSMAIILLVVLIIGIFPIYSNASDPVSNPNYYKPKTLTKENAGELNVMAGVILGAVNIVGTIIAIISVAIIGFRYLMGSLEEKAQYKETMGPYIIGAIMLFSGTTLVNVIYQIASKI